MCSATSYVFILLTEKDSNIYRGWVPRNYKKGGLNRNFIELNSTPGLTFKIHLRLLSSSQMER